MDILNIWHKSHGCDVTECLEVPLNSKTLRKAYSPPHWSGLETWLVFARVETRGSNKAQPSMFAGARGSTIMFATARTWPGILPGIQPLCFQEVLIKESPGMFPKAGKITWHIYQFAETREMTMDSPSILAGPGSLHTWSPVLRLRDGPHGQQSSYIHKNIG